MYGLHGLSRWPGSTSVTSFMNGPLLRLYYDCQRIMPNILRQLSDGYNLQRFIKTNSIFFVFAVKVVEAFRNMQMHNVMTTCYTTLGLCYVPFRTSALSTAFHFLIINCLKRKKKLSKNFNNLSIGPEAHT